MTEPGVEIVRLSESPAFTDAGRALLEAYLLLPDAWPQPRATLPANYAAYLASYPNAARPPLGEALIAVLKEAAVGQVLLVPHGRVAVQLERMYVPTDHRRQGVGRALLAEAIDWARTHDRRRIVLDVLPSRDAAIALYREAGFARIADYTQQGRMCMARDLALAD